MRQTLFLIPHSLFEGPLLIIWLVLGALILAYLYKKHGSTNDTWSFLPIYVIVAAVIHFVLPSLEIPGIDPNNPTGPAITVGMAVRGYGVCMLLAICSGIGIILLRSREAGLTVDEILGLGFWMVIIGIIGARTFYVLQKPEEFFGRDESFLATFKHVVDMTKGGIVVYGSLLGGAIAGIGYLAFNKLPMLRTADLIAPGMVLGLAIGRIGCLMNGCCYGGVCDADMPSISFPPGSAPYMQQLQLGELVGLSAVADETQESGYFLKVESVTPDSIADQLGVEPGEFVNVLLPSDEQIRFKKDPATSQLIPDDVLIGYIESEKGARTFRIADLPDRSLGTHPTQIYSAINAALLCLTLWFYWTVRKSDGEVFGLMLILYSIGRFLIEIIRRDEAGQFGTELTISQWVSIGIILLGFVIFAYARSRRVGGQLSSRNI